MSLKGEVECALASPFSWIFQDIDVLALVMPSCKSGATSPSSLNMAKTDIIEELMDLDREPTPESL